MSLENNVKTARSRLKEAKTKKVNPYTSYYVVASKYIDDFDHSGPIPDEWYAAMKRMYGLDKDIVDHLEAGGEPPDWLRERFILECEADLISAESELEKSKE